MPLDRGGSFLDEQALLVFGELALTLRVGAAVTNQFGIGESRNGLGCMAVLSELMRRETGSCNSANNSASRKTPTRLP
jgi:hypothetical protein